MRITFVIHSLGGGGAERVLARIATHWADNGHAVDILTLSDAPPASGIRLPESVNIHPLGIVSQGGRPLWSPRNLTGLATLRKTIQRLRPGCVISFLDMPNCVTLTACLGMRVPVIVSDRVGTLPADLVSHWTRLSRVLYRFAKHIVVQTERGRPRIAGSLQNRVTVIPNPVDPPGEDPLPLRSRSRKIVGIGRLTHQKGFDLLIRAFRNVAGEFSNWNVEILGEGPERGNLERLVAGEGLEGRVSLSGWRPGPGTILGDAQVFVLPSRFEGFPNALCEAMAHGCAVIAADCPTGPREIVDSERDGILVPNEDVDALTAALHRLLGSEDLRTRLGAAATNVVQRFSLPSIMKKWETLLPSCD